MQYPLELQLLPGDNGLPTFQVSAKVLFPSTKSKANIMFIFDSDTYSRWPLSIGLLKCDVKVAYGRAEYVSLDISTIQLADLHSVVAGRRSWMPFRVDLDRPRLPRTTGACWTLVLRPLNSSHLLDPSHGSKQECRGLVVYL